MAAGLRDDVRPLLRQLEAGQPAADPERHVWAAKVDVPASGVAARFYTHAAITAALAGVQGTQRAVVDGNGRR